MPITTFLDLRDWLSQNSTLRASRYVSMEEQLMSFLWIIGHNASNREAQEQFQHSGETISRHFRSVLQAMLQLYHGFVRLPPDITPTRIRSDWGKMSYFKNVRGAIDGTHILAHISSAQQTPYRNRKGTISQNVLARCSLDMYFFYVCPGWEGAANDARVLENAEAHDFPHMEGRMWLADAGYGLKPGFLTPYCTVRYHLREQALARQRPQTKEELFNLHHAQLRNVIERIFGVVKERFRILSTPMEFDFKTQTHIVLALYALHNFIRHRANGEEDDFYRKADIVREQELSSGIEEKQEDQRLTPRDQKQTSNLRESIANEMWIDYQQFLVDSNRA